MNGVFVLLVVFFSTAFWTFVARESTNWQISIYLFYMCVVSILFHCCCCCSCRCWSILPLCWFWWQKYDVDLIHQNSLAFIEKETDREKYRDKEKNTVKFVQCTTENFCQKWISKFTYLTLFPKIFSFFFLFLFFFFVCFLLSK